MGVVYADEDVIGDDGHPTAPRLKPAWSPDFLLSTAYVGRPLALGEPLWTRSPTLTGGRS